MVGVESATVFVDVAAVGGDVEEGYFNAETSEEHGGDHGGGSVGTIYDDAAAAVSEREAGDAIDEELNVVGLEGGIVFDGRDGSGIGLGELGGDQGGVMENFIFHGQLDGVGELVAVGAEELDAVVAPGIVRGGDDYASLKSMGAGEEGDGGGGNDAGAFNACSGGPKAGSEDGGDPRAGFAGIAAEKDGGLAEFLRKEWARATPVAKMVMGSSGDSPAMARMPSVPKRLRRRGAVIVSILGTHFFEDFKSNTLMLANV